VTDFCHTRFATLENRRFENACIWKVLSPSGAGDMKVSQQRLPPSTVGEWNQLDDNARQFLDKEHGNGAEEQQTAT